ncbi:hypothetical protein EYF80_017778 [Liparis tanakae]|uniref:Uncharacterized protein n=1 Tax=Liparis tanakae TaxID=230148 RepID=A0A4Z2I2D0_9TELE|nr:hypothetical protein EYF80_017778 [Liparis tanakae]
MPQALTSPISFLSATSPPPDSFSPAASLEEPDVLLRFLAPSVMVPAGLCVFLGGGCLLLSGWKIGTITCKHGDNGRGAGPADGEHRHRHANPVTGAGPEAF